MSYTYDNSWEEVVNRLCEKTILNEKEFEELENIEDFLNIVNMIDISLPSGSYRFAINLVKDGEYPDEMNTSLYVIKLEEEK